MHYPVFLDLRGKRCLVVGGGRIAERKIRALLRAGARVLCVSETFDPQVRKLARNHKIQLAVKNLSQKASFSSYLQDTFLAIGATSSPSVNQKLYEECRKRNILVNSVDDPRHSSFIAPAVVNRGALSVAISTGGASPQFAKTLREKMENLFGPEHAAFLAFMAKERGKIMRWLKDPKMRKKFFQEIVNSGMVRLFKSGHDRQRVKSKYQSLLLKYGIRKGGFK